MDIINLLTQNICERLDADIIVDETLHPLKQINSTTSAESLELCHSFIVPDLDHQVFCTQYFIAADLLKNVECKSVHDSLQKLNELSNDLSVLKVALARAVVAKPHSSDVERLISIGFSYYFRFYR